MMTVEQRQAMIAEFGLQYVFELEEREAKEAARLEQRRKQRERGSDPEPQTPVASRQAEAKPEDDDRVIAYGPDDLGAILRAWARCERGPDKPMPNPGLPYRGSAAFGHTVDWQCAVWISRQPSYRLAYPALWWVEVKRGDIESFDVETYLLERERRRVRTRIGLRPFCDVPSRIHVTSVGDLVDLEHWRLFLGAEADQVYAAAIEAMADSLATAPLKAMKPSRAPCAEDEARDVVAKVNAAADRWRRGR